MNSDWRKALRDLAALTLVLLLIAAAFMVGRNSLEPVLVDLIDAHTIITANGFVASIDGNDPRLGGSVRQRRFDQIGMTSSWICALKRYGPSICRVYSSIELVRDPQFPDAWTVSRTLGVGGRFFRWGTAKHIQVPVAQPLRPPSGV